MKFHANTIDVARPTLPPKWKRPWVRNSIVQAGAILLVVAIFWYFLGNLERNLSDGGFALTFGFLFSSASFNLGDNLVGFSAGDSIIHAIAVGISNTLLVSGLSIILATVLGAAIGIVRLSTNVLAAGVARIYIEIFRNIPLLLQMIFYYTVLSSLTPSVREAWEPLPGVFLSNRGVNAPTLEQGGLYGLMGIGLLVMAVFIILFQRRMSPGQYARSILVIKAGTVLLVAGFIAHALATDGLPISFNVPYLQGFGFVGGALLSPEFSAVALALTIYTSAFIAEIVRSGVLGVARGQTEAATSLGLRGWPLLRLVVLPQALRIIIPPLISQLLSLVKNSSLAVAVGYADIIRVAMVIIAGTGRSIEMIAIVMGIYLVISLAISLVMNAYNRSIMKTER